MIKSNMEKYNKTNGTDHKTVVPVPNVLFHEGKIHGAQDFPIEYYVCDIPQTYHYLPMHWHEEFEISMVVSGCLSYVIGNVNQIVSEGDILVIPPNVLHSACQIGQQEARTYSIVFHLRMLGLVENDACDSSNSDRCTDYFIRPLQEGRLRPVSVILPQMAGYDEGRNCFLKLWDYRDKLNGLEGSEGTGGLKETAGPIIPKGVELLVKAELFGLIHQLLQRSEDVSESADTSYLLRNAEKMKPVLSYIHEHYMDPLSIDELAALCGFSSVHFMNVFRKTVGTSCVEYIIQYRIGMAAVALKDTDQPVSQIAMDFGFANISYFNRTFKKKLGVSPSEYRKKMKR